MDQDDPMPGVFALPLILAQSDAVISLVDEEYYTRAWCLVEAQFIKTLVQSYHLHLWYQQAVVVKDTDTSESELEYTLTRGPVDREFNLAGAKISFEIDRPRVLFLERQSKLLGL